MVDNYAIPAATVRGLFEYLYQSDRLILVPHVPPTITAYRQMEPVRFGTKQVFVTLTNGGGEIRSVKINGKDAAAGAAGQVVLVYDELPEKAQVEIVTGGGWDSDHTQPFAPSPRPTSTVAGSRAALPAPLEKTRPC